mmetsp:Transcript_3614/g.4140  ORF Transcript_3614/g.4140 Transcript_3614/m.4140 type:complete len:89 (+) Transcript_3614:662-928(+)
MYTDSTKLRRKKGYMLKRALFSLKTTPAFLELENTSFMLQSMPQYAFLTEKAFDEIEVFNLMIWLEDSVKRDHAVLDQLADAFENAMP